jgi:hypothetical protein
MGHEQIPRGDQPGDPAAAKRHGAQLHPLRLDSGAADDGPVRHDQPVQAEAYHAASPDVGGSGGAP